MFVCLGCLFVRLFGLSVWCLFVGPIWVVCRRVAVAALKFRFGSIWNNFYISWTKGCLKYLNLQMFVVGGCCLIQPSHSTIISINHPLTSWELILQYTMYNVFDLLEAQCTINNVQCLTCWRHNVHLTMYNVFDLLEAQCTINNV